MRILVNGKPYTITNYSRQGALLRGLRGARRTLVVNIANGGVHLCGGGKYNMRSELVETLEAV